MAMSSTSKTRVVCGGITPPKPLLPRAEPKLVSINLRTQAWNNDGSRIRTIGHVGRDGEQPRLAFDHAEEAFVPAFDDLTRSESEFERAIAVAGGVELITVGEECSGLGVEGEPVSSGATDRYRAGMTR